MSKRSQITSNAVFKILIWPTRDQLQTQDVLDVDVAQPIAQKTTVQEVLGSIPCFAANVKTLLWNIWGWLLDIYISLLSDNGFILS